MSNLRQCNLALLINLATLIGFGSFALPAWAQENYDDSQGYAADDPSDTDPAQATSEQNIATPQQDIDFSSLDVGGANAGQHLHGVRR